MSGVPLEGVFESYGAKVSQYWRIPAWMNADMGVSYFSRVMPCAYMANSRVSCETVIRYTNVINFNNMN